MRSLAWPAAIQLALLAAAAGRAVGQAPAPHWIWTSESRPGAATFERPFELAAPPRSASLRLLADFCQATVRLNGQPLAAVEPYGPAVDADALAVLRLGTNTIAIEASAVPGPAAVALCLTIVAADGTGQTIVTDGQWQAAVSLGEAEPALFEIGRRPPTIAPFDNYEQWRQATGAPPAAAASFWTAPGFEISLVRAAQPDEGSWISLAFDEQGRATISREDKGLLRMTLAADRRAVEKVETINGELEECRGLLYAHGALYASANNSKGLYRLRDTNGDGQFDESKLLRQLPGGVGHGRNDLAPGPDGSIYWINGDSVDVPKENALDRTSPFREARRGETTREGFVLKTDREGKAWELVAAGLRNPYGLAFNERGDLFTYDADAEFDMGSPWYRPTRVDQITSGADFGWRGVTGKWPPYFPDHPDNALPTLDIGRGSPTAVMFGTNLKFPPEYRRALLILDWTYGRILAIHLLPRGAGYRAVAETFLKGRPLNVTDLAAGPDGALYLITGGRKTQSALYRLAYTGADVAERPLSQHERACRRHADAARELRLKLEQLHEPNPAALDVAWAYLNDPDPKLRYAARIAVEHQPVEQWHKRVLEETRVTAVLEGSMALARAGDKSFAAAAVEQLSRLPALELSLTQAQLLVQTRSLWQDLLERPVTRPLGPTDGQLNQLRILGGPTTRVGPAGTAAAFRRDLSRLQRRQGVGGLVAWTTSTLLASPVQEDRLHGLFLLRDVSGPWPKDERRAYFQALDDGSKFVAGEGMPKFLAQIREQAVATLTEAEKAELTGLLNAGSETNEPLPPARPLVKHWTSEDFTAHLAASKLGDAEKGATVFRDALCVRCHRAGIRGPAVGPDLTHVGGRFGPRDLLDSILTPSKVVAENYRNVQVRTIDGRTLVGRVLVEGDFRSEKLRLATQPLAPAEIVEIDKKQIDEIRESELSPMPAGLLDGFSQQDVLDLLTFLTRGK